MTDTVPCYWATCGFVSLPEPRNCETILDGVGTAPLSPSGPDFMMSELAVVLAVSNMKICIGDVRLHIPKPNRGWKVAGDNAFATVKYHGKDVTSGQQLVEPQSEAWMTRFHMVHRSVQTHGLRVVDDLLQMPLQLGSQPQLPEHPAIELVQTVLSIVLGANGYHANADGKPQEVLLALAGAIGPVVTELALLLDRLRTKPTIGIVALGTGTIPAVPPAAKEGSTRHEA